VQGLKGLAAGRVWSEIRDTDARRLHRLRNAVTHGSATAVVSEVIAFTHFTLGRLLSPWDG